jgi:hypothetical protein
MDIAPKWLEWGRQKSAELLPQYKGQLPFVVMDADDPGRIISFWQVEDTGNELDDLARGGIFAELLVQRAKHWRDRGDLRIDPDDCEAKHAAGLAPMSLSYFRTWVARNYCQLAILAILPTFQS